MFKTRGIFYVWSYDLNYNGDVPVTKSEMSTVKCEVWNLIYEMHELLCMKYEVWKGM